MDDHERPVRGRVRQRIAAPLLGLFMMTATTVSAASFESLGLFPESGFQAISADGISGDGSVVVGRAQVGLGAGTLRMMRWTAETGLEGLGPAIAFGVSNDGTVVVGRGSGGSEGSGGLRWEEGSGFQDLGALGGGVTSAYDVSADGSVVVGITGGVPGFRWTDATGMQGLPGFGGSASGFGAANAVSANGGIIVGETAGAPALWAGTANPIDLGAIGDAPFGRALGVSADGVVAVGFSGTQPFRWTAATGIQDLGLTSSEDTEGQALDVSADGNVVVGFVRYGGSFPDIGSAATIWDPVNGQRRLQDVLGALVDLEGWHLEEATAISDDGRTIVGNGRAPDGSSQAWIAVIPEPSTALLMALGLLGLSGAPRR
ncbi:MAG: PEP-CTERM sorting domain-containing protein [bacterium]|nr:PEP-CTERM sorting domain-containing protein [bacterium]